MAKMVCEDLKPDEFIKHHGCKAMDYHEWTVNKFTTLRRKVRQYTTREFASEDQREDVALLTGQVAVRQIRQLEKLDCLWGAEFRVSSQWGEDGIIEWLVYHLGDMPESFVEFGVQNYRESNTRFLLQNRNWRGLVIDGSEAYVDQIRRDRVSWRHDLTAIASFITRDNINSLIAGAGFKGELGILSVDIDGVDYWVWEAIQCVNPQVLIVEYNSAFGDLLPLTVPYTPDFVRGRAHYSNLYYGVSIRAARFLAEKRGYKFVGSNSAGNNAFFVRNDLADAILRRLVNVEDRPSRFRESRAANGALSFVSPVNRTSMIAHLPVVNVEKNLEMPLGQMGDLCSARWQALITGHSDALR